MNCSNKMSHEHFGVDTFYCWTSSKNLQKTYSVTVWHKYTRPVKTLIKLAKTHSVP